MPTTYLPNGHTLAQGLVLDEAFVKIIARQSDGTYKWVHGANNPSTAIESVVWDAVGGVTLGRLNSMNLVAGASISINGSVALDVSGGTLRLGNGFGTLLIPSTISIAGPSAGPEAQLEFSDTSNFTGAGQATACILAGPTLTLTQSQGGYGLRVNPTFVEAATGTHGSLHGIEVDVNVTDGAAVTTNVTGIEVGSVHAAAGTTNATALKILNSPTGATNTYAIWVVAGTIKLPLGGGTGIVDVGIADSGGAGFRLLRVPN